MLPNVNLAVYSKTDLCMHAYVEKCSKNAKTNQPPNFRTIISCVTKYSMNQSIFSIKSVSDIDSSIVTSEDFSIRNIIAFHLYDQCLIRAVGDFDFYDVILPLNNNTSLVEQIPIGANWWVPINRDRTLTNMVWHNGGSDLETARTAVLLMMFEELVTVIQ